LKNNLPASQKKDTYPEISAEDEMGVYPVKFNVSAVPERRYLIAAKKIMDITLVSVFLNGILGVVVFLFYLSSVKLEPSYYTWSDIDDSFIKISPKTSIQGKECRKKGKIFCSEITNEDFYLRDFMEDYLVARYTVSQDLADNERRWCDAAANAKLIKNEVVKFTTPGIELQSQDVFWGDIENRLCPIARYSVDKVYKDFKTNQANLWQNMAFSQQFMREIKVITMDVIQKYVKSPLTGRISRKTLVKALLKFSERKSINSLPKIRYVRTLSVVNRGRCITKDGKCIDVPTYYNADSYLYDSNTANRNYGLTVEMHAILPDKDEIIKPFYEKIGV
jgi:hypothetical protein